MRAPLLALALLLAGCVAAPEAGPAPEVPGVVAHRDGGVVPLPEGWADLAWRLAHTGFARGEPTVGVTSSGAIFATAHGERRSALAGEGAIARSRDDGGTWEVLRDVTGGKAEVDPWLWVDPATDRLYNAPLYGGCSWLSWSDDEGDSWTANPAGGCGLPGHDHQKLTGGPPPEGVRTSGYPSVLYYSYNSLRGDGTVVTSSLDGGRTFGMGVQAHPRDCHGGTAGPVAVAPDGRAFSPKPACVGVNVSRSDDAGRSWTRVAPIEDAGIAPHLVTLDAGVDAGGNLHVSFQGEDGGAFLATSLDGGDSWLPAKRVSPPGVAVTVFSALAAGDEGRVAVAFLGTRADWEGRNPSFAPDDAVWHLFVTFVEDARDPASTLVTLQATTEEDPVQRGCVWIEGGANPCRNLRDFIDAVERDGRLYVAFADGCARCQTAAEREALGETVVLLQEGGPRLRRDAGDGPLQGF